MLSRLKLHEELVAVLGSSNVYFQPPESIEIKYPAIVYARTGIANGFANNSVYGQVDAFQITVLDTDPDSDIVRRVSLMDTASFNKHYTASNLHHNVFTIKYNKL